MTAVINNREPPSSRPEGRPKWEPRLPEFFGEEDLKAKHPPNEVDHRPKGGPLLKLLWCDGEPLHGQTLYLGGEVGSDGKIYCIPGHAPRVLKIDPETDKVTQIGPELDSNGTKFKWLRGIPIGDVIYGLPCHASEVLRIHVPTQTITKIPIPYEEFYQDPQVAKQQRKCIWKYHGGSISTADDCIYAVPQSALHVLKIDPFSDTCSFVGPELPGKYKWYGGVPCDDGAIYCVPQNSAHVLRIHPDKVTLHGDYGEGGHKWHGAAKSQNGVVVCIPNNVDTVLCVTPNGDEPILTEVGDDSIIQTGRHRDDKKYKYLGAMAGTNGRVYIFPSGSEYVLEVDTEGDMKTRNVGPNLRDTGMERIFQNKWQNGLTNPHDQCVYAIPLAGETVLRIDCSKEDGVEVTTWPLPSPYETLDKFEGGVICPNGLIYTVPNNCKAVLKIQPASWTPDATTDTSTEDNDKKKIASKDEYGGKDDNLIYKSGIPTLRSSAHRVKFDVKRRKHDPNPLDRDGNPTGTTWLPSELQEENVFSFDMTKYNLQGAILDLLNGCNPDIVGSFEKTSQTERLEDFRVLVNSVWRSVNGGSCEGAQRYLSDQVATNQAFLELFDSFVAEVTLPHVKARLVDCGALPKESSCAFYYQRPPTLRLQPGPGWAKVKPHNDAEYGHQNGELNIWVPLTDRALTGVDLWSESSFQADDYHPIVAKIGEAIAWHGSSRRHYVNANSTKNTRVSLDFRIGVEGYFDPKWAMQGTTDDHARRKIEI
jgi:hypothetical protein